MTTFYLPTELPYSQFRGQCPLNVVERRFVPVPEGERADREYRLRLLLLKGARRLIAVSETETTTNKEAICH